MKLIDMSYIIMGSRLGYGIRNSLETPAAGQRRARQAASTDSFLHDHEYLLDDGSQSPAIAIPAFVQSDFDIGDGDKFMLIRRICRTLPLMVLRQHTGCNFCL